MFTNTPTGKLSESSGPPLDIKEFLTLGGFTTEIARRYTTRQALVYEGQSITFRELETQVRKVARGLIAAGVTKGTRVAILMSNRPEWIYAAFAIGMIGGVVVATSTFASESEREYILRHSDTSVLLLQDTFLKHHYLADLVGAHSQCAQGLPGRLYIPDLPHLRSIFCLNATEQYRAVQSWQELIAMGEQVSDEMLDTITSEVHPTDDAMIIYTSGTTANPKGVLHTHRAPCIQFWRWVEQMRLTSADRVWNVYPFFWTAGFSMSLGGTLAAGGCLILQEAFDAEKTLKLIESERVTTLYAWPHQDAALSEHPDAKKRDLSSLRNISAGSRLRELVGLKEDNWDPGAAYGLSETFTIATSIPSDSPAEIRRTTHGLPLPGMKIRIIDPATGETLPIGALGEIAVKGATLMRGYYKVLPEDYLDENGFYHTKDAGYLDEAGYLHWTGRLSSLIKTGGANVSPVEIEAELTRWGRLKAAFVVGVPHATLGEAIVLCAVNFEGSVVNEIEITDYLRSRLAVYKVPRHVLFFNQEELSFTGSDKVQLERLLSIAQERLRAKEGSQKSF